MGVWSHWQVEEELLPTVLVADDDVLVRTVLSRMLDKLGCRVLLAQDGAEALALFSEHQGRVDLLLIDMRMPGANGTEVVQRIRSNGSRVKMILMGGGEELNDVERHLAAGFTKVLPKPFDINAIRAEISQLLNSNEVDATGEAI